MVKRKKKNEGGAGGGGYTACTNNGKFMDVFIGLQIKGYGVWRGREGYATLKCTSQVLFKAFKAPTGGDRWLVIKHPKIHNFKKYPKVHPR